MYILLSYLFYFLILIQYFNFFLNVKDYTINQRLLSWVTFYIIQILLSQVSLFLLSFILNCCSIILLCRLLYADPLGKIVFFSISGCFIGMITEIVTALLLQSLHYPADEIMLAGTCISKLFLLLVIYIIKLFCFNHSFGSITPSPGSLVCLTLITIFSILNIHITFSFIPETLLHRRFILFLTSLFLSSINVCCFLLFQKLSMAQKDQNLKLILSKLITQYQAFSPEREKQITNLRREKHNLKNQLVFLNGSSISRIA